MPCLVFMLSANTSRINTDQGEGGAAYGYALAMTPLGQPYNYTNPDSASLLDTRPDAVVEPIGIVGHAGSRVDGQGRQPGFAAGTVSAAFGSAAGGSAR